MDAQTRPKAVFSALAVGLLAAHAKWPDLIKGDSVNLVLLIVAVLPWLDSLFQAAELSNFGPRILEAPSRCWSAP